jgi:hypothetical protein
VHCAPLTIQRKTHRSAQAKATGENLGLYTQDEGVRKFLNPLMRERQVHRDLRETDDKPRRGNFRVRSVSPIYRPDCTRPLKAYMLDLGSECGDGQQWCGMGNAGS